MSLLKVSILAFSITAQSTWACQSCISSNQNVVLTRHVRRMQPTAKNATLSPREPLRWGEINFIHTTDTHGWLAGHLREENYGADWGDFVSFTKAMRSKADSLGVDLLLIDTGDLHDGGGLSDATTPNGVISNLVFENIDYDLLTIGNHELGVSEIAYEHFEQFTKMYGEKYLTSNVDIFNPSSGKFESIGSKYRYFTTPKGIRIMSFGVIFDFKGNSNVSRITNAKDMVLEQWFIQAINYTEPIDLFVVIGHNPVRRSDRQCTLGYVYDAIRKLNPDTPIQIFGGHTHIRDFVVYDDRATGLEAGRYCETVGWLSIKGISNRPKPDVLLKQVPTPTRRAFTRSSDQVLQASSSNPSLAPLHYSRRFLDWNKLTFEYHAKGSQYREFETQHGRAVTALITEERKQLNLSLIYGCAPQSWCMRCAPFGHNNNIYTLLTDALATVVVNGTRTTIPRLILMNSDNLRFDILKGQFTQDESFIVSPRKNRWKFIPGVPYNIAKQVLQVLNSMKVLKRTADPIHNYSWEMKYSIAGNFQDNCSSPLTRENLQVYRRSNQQLPQTIRRTAVSPGYITKDDFGTDGDDTIHTPIPNYLQPNAFQANASFPTDGSIPTSIDLVFVDFLQDYVVAALRQLGGQYTKEQTQYYMPRDFTTNSYLPEYAKQKWQSGMPNCL